MNRSTLTILTLAAALGACSHKQASTTPAPASTTASTDVDDRRGPGGPGGRDGRGGPGVRDDMLFRGITLSADQRQRVDSIRSSYRTQMDQLRQQSGGDRQAMRGQMRPLMERQQADIRAVLTSDQQATFDQNVAEMRSRMQQRGGPGGQPPR